MLSTILTYKGRGLKMNTETTAIRGLPLGTIVKYRILAAQKMIETGTPVSMNSLYVQALTEFIQRRGEK